MICTKIIFEYSYSCNKWSLNSQCFGSQLSFWNLHSIQSLELVDVLSWLRLSTPHMCHRHHRRCLQRKILPCGEISDWTRKLSLLNEEKIYHMEKFLHMRILKTYLSIGKWIMCTIFWCFVTFYAVLLQHLFLCDLRCFIAKSDLLRTTRFGVEKNWAKTVPVDKKGQIWGMRLECITRKMVLLLMMILNATGVFSWWWILNMWVADNVDVNIQIWTTSSGPVWWWRWLKSAKRPQFLPQILNPRV